MAAINRPAAGAERRVAMTELKPCPCCGGKAAFEINDDRTGEIFIACRSCSISTDTFGPCDKAKAASVWNRRADVAPVVHGEWIGYTTSAFAGVDDCGEPKWTPKKFFRCSRCRRGTAVKEKHCPSCGARMDVEEGGQ